MARRTTPLIDDAVAEFVGTLKRQRKSAGFVKTQRSLLGRLARYVGGIQVGSITPGRVEDFFYGSGGLAETAQKQTLARYRNDVKQFFNWCHRRDYHAKTGEFLVQGIKEKSTKVNKSRHRMDPNQIIALMDACADPRDRCLVAFVANTGVRIGEALSLRIRDVSLSKGELYLTIHKKGGEVVTRAITPMLDQELRLWFLHYQSLNGPLQDDWFLFPTKPRSRLVNEFGQPGGHGPRKSIQPDWYVPEKPMGDAQRHMKRICEQAGIEFPKGEQWHVVRRSVARIYFDRYNQRNGRDSAMRMAQAMLNHSQMSTTEIYLDLDIDQQRLNDDLRAEDFLTIQGDNIVPLARVKGE